MPSTPSPSPDPPATLTFLSLVFWSYVIGPLGALLAVPRSLFVKALLVDADPAGRWLVPLIDPGSEDRSGGRGRVRHRSA